MAFPEGVQTTILTGHVGGADGTADRDTVTITQTPARVISSTYDYISERKAITVTADRSSGTWAIRLLNTDAAGFNPSGWTYQVQIGNADPFFIELPVSLGATADLADLAPVSANPGTYDVLLPASELGTAAFLDVGQVAGTVAAGDDGRIVSGGGEQGPAGPTGPKGDTGATGPKGDKGDPGIGGGTGSAAVSKQVRLEVENVLLPNTGGWAVVTSSEGTGSVPLQATIDAVAGDRIWVDVTFMRTGSGTYLDVVMLNSDGSIAEFGASGTSTAPDEGAPEFYPQTGAFPAANGTLEFVPQAGQISGGEVTIAIAYKGAGTGVETLYASAGYPLRFLLRNGGPNPA